MSFFIVVDFMTLFWMLTDGYPAVPAGFGSDFRKWRYSTTSFLETMPARVVIRNR